MATISVDQLSRAERDVVVAALILKQASVTRAARAEQNAEVAALRVKESDAIDALIAKFR